MALTLTTDQLRAAWASRRRASWPASFDDCMRDAVLAALIKLEAWSAARRAQRAHQATQRRKPAMQMHPPLRATQDLKRLAAGDRDD